MDVFNCFSALPKTPAILLVTGLAAIFWLTFAQTDAVTEVPIKSSRILNASFIQWKILQRYHPSRNLKHPSVILKLNGESGSLVSHGSSSTLSPFTVSTTTTKFRVQTAPVVFVTSKPNSLANNLIAGGHHSHNLYHKGPDSASTSGSGSASGSASVSSESKQDEEEYSDSEQSEEELSPQQSQYSIHHRDANPGPWVGEGAQRNYVGHPDYPLEYNPKPQSSSEEDYRHHGGSDSIEQHEAPVSSSSTESPKPSTVAAAAERRVDSDATDFNGIVTEFAYKYGNSHELENLAVADDDQISRYFVKTKPKDVSFSVSPIIDYTSTTPFAVTGGPTAASFPSSSSENPKSALVQSGSSTSNEYTRAAASDGFSGDGFGFDQTTTLRPNQDYDFKPSYGFSSGIPDVPTQQAYSSVPATSTNYLPSAAEKDSLSLSPHISDVGGVGVTPAPPVSTTTDATSIPGMPGIDYPILHEIPYTGFDCQQQRYKGFFADVDTKCQVSNNATAVYAKQIWIMMCTPDTSILCLALKPDSHMDKINFLTMY